MRIDQLFLENEPAIRKEDLAAIIADMEEFDGWIRCKTSMPMPGLEVHITNIKYQTIGWYNMLIDEWHIDIEKYKHIGDNIIAWRLLPEIPQALIEKCKT